jgi:Protein of unknown function (DUF3592)
MMGGLVLDIYVEFIVRVIVRLFRARGSRSWPVVKAEVTGTSCNPGGFGCAVANITYEYRVNGELYTGADANPFVSTSSAKDYLEDYPTGSELLVRVKPGRPDFSVVRQKDLYLCAHGYQLETR